MLGQQLLLKFSWKPELHQDRACKLKEYSKSRHKNELLYRTNPPKYKGGQDGKVSKGRPVTQLHFTGLFSKLQKGSMVI